MLRVNVYFPVDGHLNSFLPFAPNKQQRMRQ